MRDHVGFALFTRFGVGDHDGIALGRNGGDNPFTGLHPIQPAIFIGDKVHGGDFVFVPVYFAICNALRLGGLFCVGAAIGTHCGACVHQVVHRDAATLGHLIVVEIMCARDFHRT